MKLSSAKKLLEHPVLFISESYSSLILVRGIQIPELGFDRKKGENGRFNTSDKETMKGREFLRFLDLTLRCEISAEIRECDMIQPPTAEEAIAILNCIQVREYKGTRFVTEVDKKQRDLLKLFNLQVPKEALTNVPVFDLPQ